MISFRGKGGVVIIPGSIDPGTDGLSRVFFLRSRRFEIHLKNVGSKVRASVLVTKKENIWSLRCNSHVRNPVTWKLNELGHSSRVTDVRTITVAVPMLTWNRMQHALGVRGIIPETNERGHAMGRSHGVKTVHWNRRFNFTFFWDSIYFLWRIWRDLRIWINLQLVFSDAAVLAVHGWK